MVDRDRDLLVKRLEKDGQSRVLPAIAQAFPVEVHDELGDRRGATIVILHRRKEEEEEENSLLLDANVTWGNILASCCGFKTWSRQGLGTCLVEVQGGGWLPVEGTSQDEVVDEP